MSSSCSFRITRTTENLALTLSALSERLVKLETQMGTLEKKLIQNQESMPSLKEIEILDGVDKLLKDCHHLLEMNDSDVKPNEEVINDLPQDIIAA
tara:strand:+ start:466 stop:753 length:288 start_codon:yes stop_codon:yes gene_type:complete